jgi:hypothetical protein
MSKIFLGNQSQKVTTLSLTPKILGPFWSILGLKYVLIDLWGNDKNEMIFLYFQL